MAKGLSLLEPAQTWGGLEAHQSPSDMHSQSILPCSATGPPLQWSCKMLKVRVPLCEMDAEQQEEIRVPYP